MNFVRLMNWDKSTVQRQKNNRLHKIGDCLHQQKSLMQAVPQYCYSVLLNEEFISSFNLSVKFTEHIHKYLKHILLRS